MAISTKPALPTANTFSLTLHPTLIKIVNNELKDMLFNMD